MGKKQQSLILGIDIGSISMKFAVLDSAGEIVKTRYQRMKGETLSAVYRLFTEILAEFPPDRFERIAITGSGGKVVSEILGIWFVNEVIAQARATSVLHPQIRSIIEIGGEDSKLIVLGEDHTTIADFAMNAVCAAGTGSFLDQQASRLGVSIEQEFGTLALRSKKPPRIAGRCSVFAKSDMIHLQQEATPDYDIVAGLCYAMARNFKSTLGRGKDFAKPVAFQGGVASNAGMVRAFKDILELDETELVVPEHHLTTGAIGAALLAIADKDNLAKPLNSLEPLEKQQRGKLVIEKGPQPLSSFKARSAEISSPSIKPGNGKKINAFLGIDIGSISTNVVVIDEDRNVLTKQYLMTAGRPIEAVRKGLEAVRSEIGDCLNIVGAGTTGSGRYLIGDFVGADIVKNEITAQARAAAAIDSEVDTIFEIGGQDSKYISLENGVVVDFEMNKVCAAGTGSFLEEQAEKLGINIKEEFGRLALDAQNPVPLGERCTVFMESDIVHHKRRGAHTDNLIAGLSYSIVYNYLNRVVGDRRIGKRIFFQGGVAFNHGVVAAFEKVTGQKITVPEHHEVTGALGVAIIAQEKMTWNRSRFKGFDLSQRNYTLEPFDCTDCPNLCEIRKVVVENEEPLYYGSRCEKYNVKKVRHTNTRAGIPNLFKEREKILLNTYLPKSTNGKALTVGIPRALFFFEHYPFWSAFFGELGYRVVLSDKSNKTLIHKGLETVCAETCFPIKITHGHVLNLLEKDVDYLFLPSLIDAATRNDNSNKKIRNFNCPYVQTIPYTIRTALNIDPLDTRILAPIIDLSHGRRRMERSMEKFGKTLGISKERISHAISVAEEAQAAYHAKIQERGKEILGRLQDDDRAVVIISRPYNGCDNALNLDLPKKLSNIGFTAIPMDFLPVEKETEHPDWPNMYWRHGKRILRAADIIRSDQRLSSIFITNFGCGPDSFITHFYRRKMGDKPYLQLEVDEHSADAGAITRVEAFQDSLENARLNNHSDVISAVDCSYSVPEKAKRTLYIPHMSDHSYALMAAFQHHQINAEVLPESDEETLYWGRKFTSGKECFPCIVTTGDMVKFVKSPDFDPSRTAFFMPGGEGPCRFGQYNVLQRMILNDLGYPDLPIFAPVQDDDFYTELGMVGKGLARRMWRGLVAFDIIDKLCREIRPYEVNPEQTDEVYRQSMEAIINGIRQDHIFTTLKEVRTLFESIPIDRTSLRPIIGVVGEFFVRSSRFCNKNIARAIEKAGGEAWFSPVTEWFLYLNYNVKRQKRLSKDYLDLVSLSLTDAVQRQDEHKIYKIFKGLIRNHHEPSISQILKLSQPYIDSSFEGEAILSIGKSIDFFHKGLAGIINTMPFTCMPGTIVNAMLKRFRNEHLQIPCLNMAYDGQEESNAMTRLEAFMYQAKQFQANHGHSDSRAKSTTAALYAATVKNAPHQKSAHH